MNIKYLSFRFLFLLWIALSFSACMNMSNNGHDILQNGFDQNHLQITESSSIKKVRGQVLYLPVYSNIPYQEKNRIFDLSAFIAVHNTDFTKSMKITKVLYFNNDGKLVRSYLDKDSVLNPLGATNFFVPEIDKSGTGANFIIEWQADTLVNEPLVESVMIGLTSGQGVSFLSTGKVLREIR